MTATANRIDRLEFSATSDTHGTTYCVAVADLS